ncbi:MAG: hypothetical protein KGJ64_14585, partial [Betaproteobacteria bacterium]|nr:hypothetical protein [Betaproteobacteria bacterium]
MVRKLRTTKKCGHAALLSSVRVKRILRDLSDDWAARPWDSGGPASSRQGAIIANSGRKLHRRVLGSRQTAWGQDPDEQDPGRQGPREKLVGGIGIEPTTSCMSSKRSNHL